MTVTWKESLRWKEFPHRLCFSDEKSDRSLREHHPINPARVVGQPLYQAASEATKNQQGAPWARRCYTTFHSLHHYQFQNKGCIVNKLLHPQRIRIWKKQRFCCMTVSKEKENHVFSDTSISSKPERCKGCFRKSYMWKGKQGIRPSLMRKIVNCTLIPSLFQLTSPLLPITHSKHLLAIPWWFSFTWLIHTSMVTHL